MLKEDSQLRKVILSNAESAVKSSSSVTSLETVRRLADACGTVASHSDVLNAPKTF